MPIADFLLLLLLLPRVWEKQINSFTIRQTTKQIISFFPEQSILIFSSCFHSYSTKWNIQNNDTEIALISRLHFFFWFIQINKFCNFCEDFFFLCSFLWNADEEIIMMMIKLSRLRTCQKAIFERQNKKINRKCVNRK